MVTLLIIIYLSFISLGLPDSLLGSVWPVLRGELGASVPVAGYINLLVQACTIVSSLCSHRLVRRFGTGRVTLVSVGMTALALAGYALAPGVGWLFVCAVPLGLGGGSVDAALNNFVARHYEAKHMSWLHCFWGVGATTGPAILAFSMARGEGWRTGYATIAVIQALLVVGLLLSLPLWKRAGAETASEAAEATDAPAISSNREALRVPLVKLALVSFLFFAATETTTGLWASSYLVATHALSGAEAARVVSAFYGAITVGRFLSGFLAIKLPSHVLIRGGQVLCVVGAGLLMLRLSLPVSVAGIVLLGLGTSPIFPSMLHETPRRFGAGAAPAIMGLQMAFAYIGSMGFPFGFGTLAGWAGMGPWPEFLMLCALAMWIASELLQRKIGARETGATR